MALASNKKRLLVNLDKDLGLFLEAFAETKRKSQSAVVVELLMERIECLSEKEAQRVTAVMKKKLADNPDADISEWLSLVIEPMQ